MFGANGGPLYVYPVILRN